MSNGVPRTGAGSSEERFQRLLDAAPDAMVVTNHRGEIVIVNVQAEKLFAYRREELLGRPVEILVPERYRTVHPHYREGYFHEPRTRPMGAGGLALFGRRSDGSEFPAEISLSPLETDEGKLAITAVRDISERKRAEEERGKLIQAEEAIRLRDEFLAIASHELKTPLTALMMQLDSLARIVDKPASDDVKRRALTKIESTRAAAQRLDKLIEQLLDLSRITAGRLVLDRHEVDLIGLGRRVVSEFSDELEQARCPLRFNAPGHPITGEWDPLRIEQIIANLLSNALKYGGGEANRDHAGRDAPGDRDHRRL